MYQDLLGLKKQGKEARDRAAANPEPGQYFKALGPSGPAFSFGNGWVVVGMPLLSTCQYS
jgi:hypothetical protein